MSQKFTLDKPDRFDKFEMTIISKIVIYRTYAH